MSVRAVLALCLLVPAAALGQQPRARELGIPFPGTTGPANAITDVAGVTVGHTTLVSGSGALRVGKGPVRTGVTAVLPRGQDLLHPAFGAWWTLNGNGEMTGTTWLDESGLLYGPVMITNTGSVGVVRDAVYAYLAQRDTNFVFGLPIVAETFDGGLNDVDGHHVTAAHAVAALEAARGGHVTEGSVGGGTGMVCHGWKGGIGTSSRVLAADAGGYTVGVLVQCNYGSRRRMAVLGAPVGEAMPSPRLCYPAAATIHQAWMRDVPRCGTDDLSLAAPRREGTGSIIVVVATDAPLLPHQLRKLAKRVGLGLGRDGGLGEDSSGDIFIAFSTAPTAAQDPNGVHDARWLDNERMNPLYAATVSAVEESIVNAMLASPTMRGADDLVVPGLPADRLVAALRRVGRIP